MRQPQQQRSQMIQRLVRQAKMTLLNSVVTEQKNIVKRPVEYNPKRSIIRVYPQARVLRYKDLYTLYTQHRPILPLVVAIKKDDTIELRTIFIVGDGYSNIYAGHYFFLLDLPQQSDHLLVKMQYDNEPVRVRLDWEFFDRVYFFPQRTFRPSFLPGQHLDTQNPRQLFRYEIMKKPQNDTKPKQKNVLVLCAIHRYLKKETMRRIRQMFPNEEEVSIINTGEHGTHHFLLDQRSPLTWPQDIPQKYDLMVFEYCPKIIYTPDNLEFLLSKLAPHGSVLFLFVYPLLLSRQKFQELITLLRTTTTTFYDHIMSQQTPTPECANLPRSKCDANPDCKWIEKKIPPFCGKKIHHVQKHQT